MDILVLDAPMKFIHGKMIEQGAKEWSRYLTGQFNPVGRGTLYSQCLDKENGLRVYLYSPTITLECVGESKGYLKVVKAEDTDVLTYHKVIEEGKLIEEKITFVPVYKFQYINTKEHHDVEKFIENEKEKRQLDAYIEGWKQVVSGDDQEAIGEALSDEVKMALKKLYEGKTANKRMKEFLVDLDNLKVPSVKELDIDHFTPQYDMLEDQQKAVLEQALSTQDLYLIGQRSCKDGQETETALKNSEKALIKEMAQQIILDGKRTMVVAPSKTEVDKILESLEEEREVKTVFLEGVEDSEETLGPYSLSQRFKQAKSQILTKLDNEASKHSKHKEELDQMKAECELYQIADKSIRLSFDILDLLEETEKEKLEVIKEIEELKEQADTYNDSVAAYQAVDKEKHEVYQKLKEKLNENENLYNDMIWMKTNEESVEYTRYKELILKYGEQVKVFEEKLSVYKAQIAERTQGEENYKALEGRLLELRRQYLNQEALKQVDKSGNIETDEEVKQEIQDLEDQLQALREKNNAFEVGIISTRSLDELKEIVYKLKEEVEGYMKQHKKDLAAICNKEEVTKADVISIFERMQVVEKLFDKDCEYAEYLEGLEDYFKLEVDNQKQKQLIENAKQHIAKVEQMEKKQQELRSLLNSKLSEKPFKQFLELVEGSKKWAEQILEDPLQAESMQALEELEKAVQQREFKLHIYKEKVAFYEGMSKLKSDWKTSITQDKETIEDYLTEQVNVVGTTCDRIGCNIGKKLLWQPFEYVIITGAHAIAGLEPLIPMIRGKKAVLIGEVKDEDTSLFAKLYESCPKANKALLER